VKCLQEAKIDIVNLANNHVLDYGVEGLEETIRELDEAGIRHTGAGLNDNEAKKPAIITKDGTRIGVIGMTDNEPGWKAMPGKPGVNYLNVGDITEAIQQVKNLRSLVDILIISIHWGPNKREFPTNEFIRFARELAGSGVDIFHGHSAHVFQGLEFRGKSLIMYDTGDFIDDYAVDIPLRNDYSFLFEVELDKNGIKRLLMIPVLIENMQVNKASGEDFLAIVNIFKRRCAIFKTGFNVHKDKLEIVPRPFQD